MQSILMALMMIRLLGADDAPSKTEPARSAKKKVIRLETITVEGHIQKPQAFYILQRSNLSFEDLSPAESFVSKVSKTVEKDPF